MFDKAMRKSIQPYLEADEEVLAVVLAQAKGAGKALILGGALGAGIHAARQARRDGQQEEDSAVKLAGRMGVVVTSRRLLLFKAGGQLTMKAKELITAVPVDQVDAIEVGKGMATKPISIVVGGETYTFEAPRAQPSDELPNALEQARGMSRV
jgi:Bacterial PH domain